MGNSVSRVVGCFVPRHEHDAVGVLFSEPLDEGLGHSFCYVRPALGSPSCSPTHQNSSDLSYSDRIGMDPDALDSGPLSSSGLTHDQAEDLQKPKHVQERPKSLSETSFKAISGASVSANNSTPRSILAQEQFSSFSNIPYERPSAFESTFAFTSLPLQPIPKGFISTSGPISGSLSVPASGPLERGFMSGPLERGFMSGPLERGFMSGPLERGYLSGPLEGTDRSNYAFPYSEYIRRTKSLVRFMKNVSKPVKKAISKTVSNVARTHRSLVAPVKSLVLGDGGQGRDANKERTLQDLPLDSGYMSSDMDARDGQNLQWAQGKAGEDRVHVVLSEEHGWLFVGIYDGFSGPDAPDFLMSNLYIAIYKELKGLLWDRKEAFGYPHDCKNNNDDDISEALKQSSCQPDAQPDGLQEILDPWDKSETSERVCQSKKVAETFARQGRLEANGSHPSTSGREEFEGSTKTLSRIFNDNHVRENQVDSEIEECGITAKHCAHLCVDFDLSVPVCQTSATSGLKSKVDVISGMCGLSCDVSDKGRVVELDGKLSEDGFCLDEERDTTTQIGQCQMDLLESKEEVQQREQTCNHSNGRSLLGGKLKRACCRHKKENHRKLLRWRHEQDQENIQADKRMEENVRQDDEQQKSSRRSLVDHSAVLSALARALEVTELSYLEMADENPELALIGSCVLVMLMKDENVYIMNVGDSRAVLAHNRKMGMHSRGQLCGQLNGNKQEDHERIGARDSMLRIELERIIEETPLDLEGLETSYDVAAMAPPANSPTLCAFQLSSDHSTSIEEEVLKIKEEHLDDHSSISNDRVKGRLKVTRAFGAGFLKQAKWNNALLEVFRIDYIGSAPYITCTPSLYHHRLGPQDRFLVLSSDGLYEYLTSEEVVSHVEWFMEKFPDGDPAQYLIEELLFRAAKKAGMFVVLNTNYIIVFKNIFVKLEK
ncbi:hypothetical protein O6H91_15G019600 [Diphasiastrum complanatum]|uniref:Uncharacterized protein n=1 Tax=Diphasiastrum complanatum TaxID=34168 RepID=A0ACC2BH93_DIPCM|nr:hypothetical protein O6H91_15G019600 [Diphasiastrum complanatum]